MRFKFTVFLFALNAIVFGLIFFLQNRPSVGEGGGGSLSASIGRQAVEADHIEIRGRGIQMARVLKRSGNAWRLVEPVEWGANFFAVNRMLNQLQFLEEEASFTVEEIERSGQTLGDYGLEEPALTLRLGSDEESPVLSIGNPTDIGNNVYLLGPSRNEIFVVNRQLVDSLLIGIGDLRTREIFQIPIFEVEALSLQIASPQTGVSGDLKVRLARSGANTWLFEAPLSAEADSALVSNTLNLLTATKVLEFLEDAGSDLGEQGLEEPSMRVTLHGNKRRQTLILGNRVDRGRGQMAYFAKLEGNPTIFMLEAKAFDELKDAQNALRERNFISFEGDALSAIQMSEGSVQLRLQKLETAGWQVIRSDEGSEVQPQRADPERVARLIEDLNTLRAVDFAVDAPSASDLERLGFNAPRRTIALSFGDGKKTTLLLAHPETENDRLYARTDRSEVVYEIERRRTLQQLPLSALYYRHRLLDNLPEAARVTALKLVDLASGETLFEHRIGNADVRWANVLDELPDADREAVLALIAAIRSFYVQNYLQAQFSADAYELDSQRSIPWRFRLSAEIALPGGDTERTDTRVYFFTERLSGTRQIGGSEVHGSVFEIVQATLDALYAFTEELSEAPELLDDAPPPPPPVEPLADPVLSDDAGSEATP